MIRLRDGRTLLTLNMTQKVFGRTKYGTFQIKLPGLKKQVIRTATPG